MYGLTTGIGFLSDEFEREATDVLFIMGGIAAFFGLYATMRVQFPAGARLMTWPFKALWWIIRTIFTVPRWMWRQLWREPDGVTRGPATRITRRLKIWLTGIIDDVVNPQFESVRSAAKEQHDEQNDKIDDQTIRMTEGFDRIHARLDRGASIMAKHDAAIADFERRLNADAPDPEHKEP